jgi:putative heme iron utilization protein
MPSKVESDVDRGARQLLNQRGFGVLITNAQSLPGYPFGSLSPYALDAKARPIFLLSGLAIHSANLLADPRASLFVFAEAAETATAVAARLNVIGKVRPIDASERDEQRALYIARHPESAQWAEFGDFAFYVLEPEQMYFVGGFGVMGWVTA